ncbi:MAG TPA: hypothetical protein VHG35_06215, partial [Gemmatimonadales bacterium]|nr:hypothetical protein [Gemmatimonadales bacterium]
GLAEHELAHLLGSQAGLGEQRHDPGPRDDAGQEAVLSVAAGCFAAQSLQRVTPRNVQMRQMKAPQPVQG